MKRRTIIAAVAVLIVLSVASCNNKQGETPSGVKYTVVRSGDGKVAKEGEVVVMEVAVIDEKDSAWFDSRKMGMPEMIMIRPDSFKKDEYGIMELFRLVSSGDSVLMTIPASDFFQRTWMQPVPADVDPNSPFTIHVATKHVLDSASAIQMRNDLYTQHQRKLQEEEYAHSANQLGLDTVMIDEHLAAKNLKAQKTASGIRYIIKKEGRGPKAVNGQIATMTYKGYLMDGRTFDEGSYSFPVGGRQVIDGWDQTALLMNVGTKLTAYIPSTLAYGSQRRSEEILENTILVFDMELTDLK